jgi:urease accessory protein
MRGRSSGFASWGCGLALASIATAADAHSLAGAGGSDLANGFAHPFSGLDHQLAMLAIGCWAAQLEGRARFALPILFVFGAAFGLTLGGLAIPAPIATALLAASVVALGLCLASAIRTRIAFATLAAFGFGLLHGHAHVGDAAACLAPAEFGAGFLLATALLHAAGFSLGVRIGAPARSAWTRAAGGAIALAGSLLLAIALH